ncbi:hypothetical protein JCM17844_28290 [Iodidimonas gelatinilytica]|uniref:Uncharacterized protein n=1 Tax=Iodidimonas gelatinilytica TaxID=1236966 RepID=A0A5A7MT26_9PROT|nr:hypothetical protein JCM17844_28290 [Iodidimonas gelatinilytica]
MVLVFPVILRHSRQNCLFALFEQRIDKSIPKPEPANESGNHQSEYEWTDHGAEDEKFDDEQQDESHNHPVHLLARFDNQSVRAHGGTPFSPDRLSPLPFPASHSSPDLCGVRL